MAVDVKWKTATKVLEALAKKEVNGCKVYVHENVIGIRAGESFFVACAGGDVYYYPSASGDEYETIKADDMEEFFNQ